MKKDNKGFSLLELIIVIGIASIIAGSAVSFTGYIRYANSKSCAEKLYSGVDKLQVTSMSKKQKKVMIVWYSNGVYYLDVYSYDPSTSSFADNAAIKTACSSACIGGGNATKLGNSALVMKYKKDDGSYETLTDGGDPIYIAYNSNGSFNDGLTDTDEIVIESSGGDGMRYTIKLVKQTGKHFIR